MRDDQKLVSVLFVCTGNICRSPTAEGVFRAMLKSTGLAEQVAVDSAGIAGYHKGEPPDERSTITARNRGIDLSNQRARQLDSEDFETFDFLVAMDQTHFDHMMRLCPESETARIKLLLDYAPQVGTRNVPDPYYGAHDGFNYVLDLVEAGSTGLLQEVRDLLKAKPDSEN
jgi:protein-tyrosine phosphatase